jgi:conjugal transfer mating pair stabilization protein TraG
MVYSLETIGSGEVLWTLFNAIAALLRPNGGTLWQSLISIGTIIGVIIALCYTIFKNSFKPLSTWFISTQIVILGLISPVATIHIKDVLTGFNKTVDNVPFALAFSASTLSSLGTGITQAIETVFQPAPNYVGGSGFQPQSSDTLAYSQTGFMFAANVMTQMKGIQISNDDMMDNMKEFVNQCVVYDALIGTKYTLHDLKRSDDIWGLVSQGASKLRGFAWRNITRNADGMFKGSRGTEIITCQVGVERFTNMWREASQSLVSTFEHRLSEYCGFASRTTPALSNAVHMNLPGAFNKLTHAGKQASEQLQQQVMISSILNANDRKAIELGGSPNLDVRRAYLQQRSMYQTIGETIAQGLPSLKNVLEAVIYALFIFVVFASMPPNGWKMLTFYTKLLLWIQLWPPLFAILNFIMTEILSAKTAGILGTTTGVTIANMVGLSNLTQDMAAIAGYLAVFIPVLSWTLIELGGYSFVSMVSSVLGVSQSAATNAAMEKVQGNYSAGNVSLEGVQAYNSSMLKHDTSGSYTGNHFAMNEGLTAKTVMADGETVLNQAGSHMHVTPTLQHSKEEMLREAQTKADALQTSQSEAASSAYRSAASNYVELGKTASQQKESGISYENQTTANVMSEAAKNYEKLKQVAHKYGISEDIIQQHVINHRAGIGVPKIMPFDLGMDYQNSQNSQSIANSATEELNQLMNSDSFKESISHMKQASDTKSFHTNNQHMSQLAQNMSGSFEKSQQYEQSANKLREASQSIQKERAENQMYGSHIDANLTQEWVNEVGAEKLQNMSMQEQIQSANHFAQQKMDTYRNSQFKKLNLDVIERDFDQQYKSYELGVNAHAIQRNFNANQESIEHKAYKTGVPTHIDTAPKKEAEQMIATQQSTLQTRSLHMKNQVVQGENRFKQQVSTHNDKKFTDLQGAQANQLYKKVISRNETH